MKLNFVTFYELEEGLFSLFSLHGFFCFILSVQVFFSVVMDVVQCFRAIRNDTVFVCNYAPKLN